MNTIVRNFNASCRAVVAMEFALVAPMMIILWMGIVELSSAHLSARKVEIAAQSAADLIAQVQSTTGADLDDIGAAVEAIIAPIAPQLLADIEWSFASIESDDVGAISVQWDYPASSASVPTEATSLLTTDDSVIMVTVTHKHHPVLVTWLWSGITEINFSETTFARPRLVPKIAFTP